MKATIEENALDLWTITLADLTTGFTYSNQFTYDGPGSSAEWIVEGPDADTVGCISCSLAPFGTTTTNISVTDSNPAAVVQNTLDMTNSSGSIIAGTSPIVDNAFTVTYDPPVVTPTPTPTTPTTTPTTTPAPTPAPTPTPDSS